MSASLAGTLVALTVRQLPLRHRDRYRRELAAELADLPGDQRLGYALRGLVRAWSLRAALLDLPSSTIGETTMPKPLRCRLGLHDWCIERNPDGDMYQACTRCPAERDAVIIGDAGSGNASGMMNT